MSRFVDGMLAMAIDEAKRLEKRFELVDKERMDLLAKNEDLRFQLDKIRRLTSSRDRPADCDEAQPCPTASVPTPPSFEAWNRSQPQVMTRDFAVKKYREIFGLEADETR